VAAGAKGRHPVAVTVDGDHRGGLGRARHCGCGAGRR
jgi:hypothetical protein